MSRLSKPSLLLLAAVLLLPGPAYAQVGGVAGTVRDTSGAVMRGVTVEVTSPALIEKSERPSLQSCAARSALV